jgi:multimeric flavodoxin WrbA
MNAIAINGSPRKKWNTATLLESALAGAQSNGADTELVHLYDLKYRGCLSCFECKKLGGKSYGRCAQRDALAPLLAQAAAADVLILGSPMYLQTETGEMRSFLERLLFPYIPYTPEITTIFSRKIPTGLIYAMGITEDVLPTNPVSKSIASTKRYMTIVFGSCETMVCTDTYQFDDYAKYLSTRFDPVAKARRREEVFPQDCRRAFDLGARLVAEARALYAAAKKWTAR